MTYFPITFASLGDTATIPTTGTEVGPINFQYGYGSNYSASLQTDPNALQVDRLTFNYMINQLTGNWQALYQTGAVPFITAAQNQGSAYAYAAHALVGAPDGNLFYSLTSSNTTTPGTAPSSWHLVNPYNLKSRQVLALSGVTGGTYNFAPTGTGCTLTYTVTSGVITAVTAVAAGGTGYVVGDLLTPNAGNYDAVICVLTVSAGAVATVQILNGGTGFTAGTAVATQRASSNVAKISLAGTLTSNASVILLNAPLQIIASNNTTGAFTTTFFISNGSGGSTGTGAVVPQGTIDSRAITLESSGATDIYQCASAALVDGLGTALPNNVTTNTQVAGTNNTTVATTAYADASSAAAALSANAGLQVYSATTTNIPGTYSGGPNPTFTATATGLISLDGVATALGQYNLLKDLSNAAYNGVYVVTTLGSTGVSTVWTRRSDYNSPTEINGAGPIAITNGATQAGQAWILTTQVTTLGTDPLTYQIFTPKYSQILQLGGALGTPSSGNLQNCSPFTGDSGTGGVAGIVPAPAAGDAAAGKVLGAGGGWVAAGGGASVARNAQTAAYTILASDKSALLDFTGAANATFSFTAAATLGNGWFCFIRNNGTAQAELTLDPNAAELIDGLSTFVMYPGEERLVQCDGSAFASIVLKGFMRTYSASGTFTAPPGYQAFDCVIWGGGGGTTKADSSVGGGGGACNKALVSATSMGSSQTISVGAGGTSSATTASVTSGGTTSIGTLLYAYGGGGNFINTTTGGGGGGAQGAGSSAGSGGNPKGATLNGKAATSSAYAVENLAGGGGGGYGVGTYCSGADSVMGGGGGGGNYNTGANGGNSVYGGGGGAGGTSSAGTGVGGLSIHGGNGGGYNQGGSVPGGGAGWGASTGNGAAGQVIIRGVV